MADLRADRTTCPYCNHALVAEPGQLDQTGGPVATTKWVCGNTKLVCIDYTRFDGIGSNAPGVPPQGT